MISSRKILCYVFTLILSVAFCQINTAFAQTLPQAYKNTEGKWVPLTLTTSLNGAGETTIKNYKGNDGLWHTPLVTLSICGVDPQGFPVKCPSAELSSYIRKSIVNILSGMAGLDRNSQMIAPVQTNLLKSISRQSTTGTPALSFGASNTDNGSVLGAIADGWSSPNALILGGQYGDDGGNRGRPVNTGGQMIVRGQPDGPNDLGCLICTVATDLPFFASRAGLNSSFISPKAIATYGGLDGALHYTQTGSVSPRAVIQGVTYAGNRIYMPNCAPGSSGACQPLTKQQLKRIHSNEYVATNSLDATESNRNSSVVDASGNIRTLDTYVGWIADWDTANGTYIDVAGWGILGSNRQLASGETPQNRMLDIAFSNYPKQTLFLGVTTQSLGHNTLIQYNPENNPDSLDHSLAGHEYDFWYQGTASGQAHLSGILLSSMCKGAADAGNGNCKYDWDHSSYAFEINGVGLSHGIVDHMPMEAMEYEGYNMWVPSNGGNGPAIGSTHAFFNFTNKVDSTAGTGGNNLNFGAWVQREDTGNIGWAHHSVRLGLNIDGSLVNNTKTTGISGGQNEAQIVWNYPGFINGLCLLGNQGQSQGLCTAANGESYFTNGVHNSSYFAGQWFETTDASQNFWQIANTGHSTGDFAFCADCIGPTASASGEYIQLIGNTWTGMTGAPFGSGDLSQPPTLTATSGLLAATPGHAKPRSVSAPTFWASDSQTFTLLGTHGQGYVNLAGVTAGATVASAQYATTSGVRSATLSAIVHMSHQEGDHVWCHNCRNIGQGAGAGTGRWIFLDSASTWRNDDGTIAAE